MPKIVLDVSGGVVHDVRGLPDDWQLVTVDEDDDEAEGVDLTEGEDYCHHLNAVDGNTDSSECPDCKNKLPDYDTARHAILDKAA